jgi:hypothetical protein
MCNEMIDNYSGILFDKKYNKVIVERMSVESNIRKKKFANLRLIDFYRKISFYIIVKYMNSSVIKTVSITFASI